MRGKAKTAHVNVRMTPEERAIIVARSSGFGMPPSTFMRKAALMRTEKPVRFVDAEEMLALCTDLKRAGNLLNQAVRLGHTHGLSDSNFQMMEAGVRGVSNAAERIAELLKHVEEED